MIEKGKDQEGGIGAGVVPGGTDQGREVLDIDRIRRRSRGDMKIVIKGFLRISGTDKELDLYLYYN